MAEEGHKVMLNVYDLSQGLARQLSGSFLGKAIEAVWHTGIVMDGVEYYFGAGIQRSPAGATPYGTPVRVVDLGVTHVPKEVFEDYLQEISPRYTSETYSLLTHNCNNFTNEVAQFLVGSNIPDYILQLPNEVMNSPMGALIMPLLQGLETTMKSGAVPQAPRFMPSTPSDALRPASTPKRSTNVPSSSGEAKFENLSSGVKTLKPEKQPSGSDSPSKRMKAENCVMPSTEGANLPEEKTVEAVSDDPLGAARKKVQEEIKKEFVAIMAVGDLRASEAAALATRRVMERHGRIVVPTGQS